MVVDDDVAQVDGLTTVLEAAGFAVLPAYDGQEALRALLTIESLPDVVLVDLRMPMMDGRQLMELMRSYRRTRALRVLVLTGFDLPSNLPANDGVLLKPVSAPDLLAAVRRIVAE